VLSWVLIPIVEALVIAFGLGLADAIGWITIAKPWTANLQPRRLAPILLVVIVANGLWFGYVTLKSSQADSALVTTYCHIGSVSAAREQNCETHVTAAQIRRLNTPAATRAQNLIQQAACQGDPNSADC